MRATLSAWLVVLVGLAMVGTAGWFVPAAQAWLPGGDPQAQVEVPPPLPNPGPLPAPNPIDPPCKCSPPPPPCHETPEPSALLLGVVGVGLFGLCSLRRR